MKNLYAFAVRHRYQIVLACAMLLGAILRFVHLDAQSFWLDELHTAIEIDPAYGRQSLWYFLSKLDVHPPLFFYLERIPVFLFGNNEVSLRLIPALAGTACVWAIYDLGRTFMDRRTGIYAALFMAVNAFCIQYSTDARPYSLTLFFCIMSWSALVRLVRNQDLRGAVLYALWVLLMLYTNYFSLFIVVGQGVLGLLLWFSSGLGQRLLKRFLVAALLVAVGYAPLLPLLRSLSQMTSFWIEKPGEDFAIRFFYEQFGDTDLLKPVLYVLLICFFARLVAELRPADSEKRIMRNPLILLTAACFLWIVSFLYIPYLRSLLVVPMLVGRYTILILPAYILLLAAGLSAIGSGMIRGILAAVFCMLSVTHLVVVKRFYSSPSKTQFRELAQFINAPGSPAAPVLTLKTAWHQRYYLQRFGYPGRVPESPIEPLIDSFMNNAGGSPFWLTGAHLTARPDSSVYARLGSRYFVARSTELFDAWGQLFLPRNIYGDSSVFLEAAGAEPSRRFADAGGRAYYPLWENGRLDLRPAVLRPGRYTCIVLAKGTPAGGVFPRLRCLINGTEIGAYNLTGDQDMKRFRFELRSAAATVVSLVYENDIAEEKASGDRNAFIHSVILAKQN